MLDEKYRTMLRIIRIIRNMASFFAIIMIVYMSYSILASSKSIYDASDILAAFALLALAWILYYLIFSWYRLISIPKK